MIFSKFRNRKKNKKELLQEAADIRENKYENLIDKNEAGHHVVDLCEQIIDAAREYEDARSEYILVTNYLKDIEILEAIPENDRKNITEIAYNVAKLNKSRSDFMKTEKKLSDSQFAMLQEMENIIPDAITRLKSNEDYLNTIQRDLNYLEGEKVTWEIGKNEFKREQTQLRSIAIGVTVIYGFTLLLLFILFFRFNIDISVSISLVTLVAFGIGAYVYLKYQDCVRGIKKCDINRNHAISLENRVKIKYVNIKNAVDYCLEKYHVTSGDELNTIYEQYMEAIRDRERFRKTSDELERYNKELIFALGRYGLYDSRVWLNYANALINKNDMVELKHNLIQRRQKLRNRMEYNITAMTELRSEILLHRNELGDRVEQVNQILKKISQLNMNVQ